LYSAARLKPRCHCNESELALRRGVAFEAFGTYKNAAVTAAAPNFILWFLAAKPQRRLRSIPSV